MAFLVMSKLRWETALCKEKMLNINLDWSRILIHIFNGRSLKEYFHTYMWWVLITCISPFLILTSHSALTDSHISAIVPPWLSGHLFVCESLVHMRKGMWYLPFFNYFILLNTLAVSNIHSFCNFIILHDWLLPCTRKVAFTGFLALLSWRVF